MSTHDRSIDLGRALVREPDVGDARHYARRVLLLALIHPALFALSLVGIVLVLWRGRFFVTLSQRSNVETLTIAFLLLFFAYIGSLSLRGAWGGLRVLYYRLLRRLVGDGARIERRKNGALGAVTKGPSVALNLAIERSDRPGEPFELELRDDVGSLGRLRVDGVRLDHVDAPRGGSNDLFSFFTRQVAELTAVHPDDLAVVQWMSIDDESLLQFVATAKAIRALGSSLQTTAWPTLQLSAAQCAELERRFAVLCPTLREEAFLPRWEFQGEHKLPIIPEPLGIISLKRSERRVDALSSMTAALLIISIAVALLVFFIVRPPWVPGR
ncbi:MAG TPA: hypothetical protein VN947_30425 [Polyangia bacterium]|nr:hypothetical protein [Polyangia bacterium]